MMTSFLNHLETIQFSDDLLRNIKTIQKTQDLFDDLSDNPRDWEVAKKLEVDFKPKIYGEQPILNRPFEEANFIQAIEFPFDPAHWNQSRYSNGNFGVWYGALELETTIYETLHHWRRFVQNAHFKELPKRIIGERSVYKIHSNALFLDFRNKVKKHPALIDPIDYTFTQTIGEYLQSQGYPGLLSKSARCDGVISAIFTPKVLSNPRNLCYLTYTLDTTSNSITVKRGKSKILTL